MGAWIPNPASGLCPGWLYFRLHQLCQECIGVWGAPLFIANWENPNCQSDGDKNASFILDNEQAGVYSISTATVGCLTQNKGLATSDSRKGRVTPRRGLHLSCWASSMASHKAELVLHRQLRPQRRRGGACHHISDTAPKVTSRRSHLSPGRSDLTKEAVMPRYALSGLLLQVVDSYGASQWSHLLVFRPLFSNPFTRVGAGLNSLFLIWGSDGTFQIRLLVIPHHSPLSLSDQAQLPCYFMDRPR
jgi:hypothetical protein